jgi:hypothetical protein
MTTKKPAHKDNQNEEAKKVHRQEDQARTSQGPMSNESTMLQHTTPGLPPHQTNLDLRQKSILQMQQTRGNAHVQRQLSSPRSRSYRGKTDQRPLSKTNTSHHGLVQRDPSWAEITAQFGTVGEWTARDMVETNWAEAGMMTGFMLNVPQNPATVQMSIPENAPRAPVGTTRRGAQQPSTRSECETGRCHPSHHQSPNTIDWDRFDQIQLSMDRHTAWQAIGQKINSVQTGWNRLVPMITDFNNAEGDATLQNPEMGMQAFGSGESGNLEQLAEQQNVPRTGASGITLGSLFSGDNNTELNLNRSDDRAIGRASRDPQVEQAVLAAQEADANVRTTVAGVTEKITGVEQALNGVSTAVANLQLAHAENEQETAQQAYASAVSARDGMKSDIKDLLDLTKGLVSVAGGDASALWDISGLAANRIVDAAYASRISGAKRRLDTAISRVQGARITSGEAALIEAKSAVNTALAELTTARLAVKAPLIARRSAYNNLAATASRRSGGGAQTRSRIAGAIAAIPPTEVAVQRISSLTSAASSALSAASYTRDSGVGYTMAQQNGQDQTLSTFVTHYALLHAVNMAMNSKKATWDARLRSLRSVVTRLGGLGGNTADQ